MANVNGVTNYDTTVSEAIKGIKFEFKPRDTKEFTIDEFLDAIEQNGITQAFNEYYTVNGDGKTIGACALGQAGINLGVEIFDISGTIDNLKDRNGHEIGLASRIIKMNDRQKHSFQHIAQYYRRRLPKYIREQKLTARVKTYNLG